MNPFLKESNQIYYKIIGIFKYIDYIIKVSILKIARLITIIDTKIGYLLDQLKRG